jgi:hypothetical protein
MEPFEEFLGINIVQRGRLFVCQGDAIGSINLVSWLLFSLFGGGFNMIVWFEV